MKVIDRGHVYYLEPVGQADGQFLRFVKNRGAKYPGNTGEPHGGLIVQEVLRALIDRTAYLNGQGSCMETEMALADLRSALAWFEVRAARCRGDYIDLPHAKSLESQRACETCGHVSCSRGDNHERRPGTWR